ncbi:MAG: response regulator [Rhodocyclaceae bacterium]|nr:response regulator [Rhodocyclaceae bacterium]
MESGRVLLVEDDPVYLELLKANLIDSGYEVIVAETGAEARSLLTQLAERLDALLLDRRLPDMDALRLVAEIKRDRRLALLPIVMQTAMTAPEEVAEGLAAGVHYYLTKPYRPEALLAILGAAVKDRRAMRRLEEDLRASVDLMRHIDYLDAWFRTPEEARKLAAFAARVFPDPGRLVLGLSELMLNAIEHGNLGIGYAEKTRLIAEERFDDEVARRLAAPEYSVRRAHLFIERLPGAYEFTIKDEGSGFDWREFLELSPERATHTHGRGIAIARSLSFDSLEYKGCGNTVVARVAV